MPPKTRNASKSKEQPIASRTIDKKKKQKKKQEKKPRKEEKEARTKTEDKKQEVKIPDDPKAFLSSLSDEEFMDGKLLRPEIAAIWRLEAVKMDTGYETVRRAYPDHRYFKDYPVGFTVYLDGIRARSESWQAKIDEIKKATAELTPVDERKIELLNGAIVVQAMLAIEKHKLAVLTVVPEMSLGEALKVVFAEISIQQHQKDLDFTLAILASHGCY